MASAALALAIPNALFLAAGAALLRGAGRWWTFGELWPQLGLAYMAGVAAVGVLAQLALVLGASLTRWEVVVLCVVVALLALRRPARGAERADPRDRTTRSIAPLAAALVAAAVVLLGVALAFEPLAAWDAWQLWTPKAHAILLDGGLDPARFGAAAYRVWSPDYPFFLPALEAIAFRFMGYDTQIVHLQFWLLYVGFLASLAALLRPHVTPLARWATLVSLAWAPALLDQVGSALADAPLAFFFALSGVCAWLWYGRRDRGAAALAAIFSAATVATKAEGAVYVAALLLTLLVLGARRLRRSPLLAAAALGTILVGIVPWRAWAAAHDVRSPGTGARGVQF